MSKASNRLTRSPGAGIDPALQPLLENLEILNGARGNGLDRSVLMRDLVDLGYITMTKGAGGKLHPKPSTPNGGVSGGGTAPDPTVEFPTKPLNVSAAGGFSNILVEWDAPTYKGHAYAEVWRAGTDDFSLAAKIGQTAANLLSDTVGENKTYYYWVKFVNRNNQTGPIQSTNGVMAQTTGAIGDILDQLKGQIDESFLTPGFNNRLDSTDSQVKTNADGIVTIEGEIVDIKEQTDVLSVEADLLAEAAMNAASGVDTEGNERRKITAEIKETQKVLITDQAAMAQKITEISVKADQNEASITQANTAIIELDKDTQQAIGVITQRLDRQESTLNDTTSAVETNSQTIAKIDKDGTAAYEAQWGVKATVGDIQAGIGLTVKDTPQGKVSQCTIIANQFSIGHVKTDGSEEIVYPFIIAPDPTSGKPGVFIDTAFIKAATVQDLVAGSVVADTVKASAEITAPKIKGGTIEIGSNFTVDENGNLVANNMQGNNANLSGGLNVTRNILSGGPGNSPQGRSFEVTSGGYLYAENGKFYGEVRADRIIGDIVSSTVMNVNSSWQTTPNQYQQWKTIASVVCRNNNDSRVGVFFLPSAPCLVRFNYSGSTSAWVSYYGVRILRDGHVVANVYERYDRAVQGIFQLNYMSPGFTQYMSPGVQHTFTLQILAGPNTLDFQQQARCLLSVLPPQFFIQGNAFP